MAENCHWTDSYGTEGFATPGAATFDISADVLRLKLRSSRRQLAMLKLDETDSGRLTCSSGPGRLQPRRARFLDFQLPVARCQHAHVARRHMAEVKQAQRPLRRRKPPALLGRCDAVQQQRLDLRGILACEKAMNYRGSAQICNCETSAAALLLGRSNAVQQQCLRV